MIVIGFKSVEELYPSPRLGVDSSDTSQLPMRKNLQGQFQYFHSPARQYNSVTPLYQCVGVGLQKSKGNQRVV